MLAMSSDRYGGYCPDGGSSSRGLRWIWG